MAQGAFGDSENPKVAEMREKMRTRLAAQEEEERSAKQATVEKAANFLEKFYEVGPSPPRRLCVCQRRPVSCRTLHSQHSRHEEASHCVDRQLRPSGGFMAWGRGDTGSCWVLCCCQ